MADSKSSQQPKAASVPKMKGGAGSGVGRLQLSKATKKGSK
jgi:hypothetical protein